MKTGIGRYSKLNSIKERIAKYTLNMPARSSLYFTATNLIAKGASFIFTPIFTRLLTASEYGEYSLFSTYLSVAIVIVSLELPGGVIMRAFQKQKELSSLTVVIAGMLTSALAFPAVFVLNLIKSLTGGGLSFRFGYSFLLISLISLSVINLYVSRCKFYYKWVPSLAVSVIQSILTPLCSILLIEYGGLGKNHHVAAKVGTGAVITLIIAVIIAVITLIEAKREIARKNMKSKDVIDYARRLLLLLSKLSLPLLPYYFSIMLISQADKLYISSYLGNGALGKYSVAYSAGIALTAVTGGVTGALCPWIMRKIRAGNIEKIKETLGLVLSFAVPTVIIFLSVAPDVFKILAPSDYAPALPVLFIIAQIPIPLALSQCMSSIAIAKERVGGVLVSGLIPALIALSLGALLIPHFSITTPALITASSFLVLAVCETVNIRNIIGKSIINVNNTFQKLLFLCLFSVLIYAFRDIIIARILIGTASLLYLLYMLKRASSLLTEDKKEGA